MQVASLFFCHIMYVSSYRANHLIYDCMLTNLAHMYLNHGLTRRNCLSKSNISILFCYNCPQQKKMTFLFKSSYQSKVAFLVIWQYQAIRTLLTLMRISRNLDYAVSMPLIYIAIYVLLRFVLQIHVFHLYNTQFSLLITAIYYIWDLLY